MSGRIKDTCRGCRASEWKPGKYTCKLNYDIDTIHNIDGTIEIFPLEPCPKPLTFDAYYQIVQALENKETALNFAEGVKPKDKR
jgi:hypothetical protein